MMQIRVEGMDCQGCVRSVTRALQARAAQAQVTVDLAAQLVAVDGPLSEADVRAAIAEAGFTVLGIEG